MTNTMRRLGLALILILILFPLASQSRFEQFGDLDAKVRALPKASSIAEVASMIQPIASTRLDQVRAVYIWMTGNIAYDVDSFFSGNYRSTSAADVFRYGSSVCQGYSNLFGEICKALGIQEVQIISGYAKAYSYSKGQSFSRSNHAWNAVYVDGRWLLLDSTWGAGHVSGRSFVRNYQEIWFDTDPRLFRINHLPEDERWQLCPDRLSLAAYTTQAFMATYELSALYQLGFSADDIYSAYTSGRPWLKSYTYADYPMVVESAPIEGQLSAGKEYSFSIYAPKVTKAALINNGKWTFITNEGGYLRGTISPAAGRLQLNAYINYSNQTSYWGLLDYSVK